mgnify:CR=1 FL=1
MIHLKEESVESVAVAIGLGEAAPFVAPEEDEPEPEVSFESGGLGLSRKAWEAIHGKSDGEPIPGFQSYEHGSYLIIFIENRIWHLEVDLPDSAPVSLDEARSLSSLLLPADSLYVETYELPDRGIIVDRLHSESLAAGSPPN